MFFYIIIISSTYICISMCPFEYLYFITVVWVREIRVSKTQLFIGLFLTLKIIMPHGWMVDVGWCMVYGRWMGRIMFLFLCILKLYIIKVKMCTYIYLHIYAKLECNGILSLVKLKLRSFRFENSLLLDDCSNFECKVSFW